MTFQQEVGDLTNTFSWSSTSTVTTSIIGTPDPCGNISYQVFDYSTGSDQTVNSAIFSFDDTSPPTISLNNASTDLNDAGIYTFRFFAFYDDYEAETKV